MVRKAKTRLPGQGGSFGTTECEILMQEAMVGVEGAVSCGEDVDEVTYAVSNDHGSLLSPQEVLKPSNVALHDRVRAGLVAKTGTRDNMRILV